MRYAGLVILAVWLILQAVVDLLHATLPQGRLIFPILALLAGALLLLDVLANRFRELGMLLLAVWLVLQAVIALFGLAFTGRDLVLAGIAIVAGLLLILKR